LSYLYFPGSGIVLNGILLLASLKLEKYHVLRSIRMCSRLVKSNDKILKSGCCDPDDHYKTVDTGGGMVLNKLSFGILAKSLI